MLDDIHIKTEAGRAEIKARSLPLTRAARNLLLVIDGNKTAREWLGLVQGITEADLQTLLEHGLLVAKSQPAPSLMPATPVPPPPTSASQLLAEGWARTPAAAAPAPATTPPAATPATPAAAAPSAGMPSLDRAALYTYLSGEATRLLGTFKGYSFALEVERCNTLEELQLLALQLVERVQKAKGDAVADEVRAALGLKAG